MSENTNNNVSYKVLFSVIGTLLIAVLGFISTAQITKLEEIQKDLMTVKLQIAEIQAQMLTRNDVRLMIKDEVEKWHKLRREEREQLTK